MAPSQWERLVLSALLVVVGVPVTLIAKVQNVSFPVKPVAISAILIVALMLVLRATRQPMERRLDQLGNAFDVLLSRQSARYDRQYRKYLLALLRPLDSKGLTTIAPFTPELAEVYVDVALTPRAPSEVPAGALSEDPASLAAGRPLAEYLGQPEPVVLAVLGGPGSGKTTILRRIAYQETAARRGHRRTTPVMLALRDHAAAIVADSTLMLPALLRAVVPCEQVTEPPGWWSRKLRDGDCLMLFDGLDEIAQAEDRSAVSSWIERQISVFPANDYVVTSRPLGYEKAHVSGAVVLWARPFNDDQVTRFLRSWYLATERRAAGKSGPDVVHAAEQGASDLLERLAEAPALYELTVNPLLLTMIANVHRYRGALPGSRAELYGEICQVMLYRRQEAKRQPQSVDILGSDKEALLAYLAFTMMSRRVRDLSGEEIRTVLKPQLARLPGTVSGEAFLADTANNGLLVEREHHLYSFAHHTFGEYLAARHIATGNQVRVLIRNVDDAWWRETTLLHLALPGADADPIVRACLRSGGLTALALAFAAAAGRPLAPDLRQQLNDTHMLAFRPDAEPTHRRLIAAVLAADTLSPWLTTPDGTHICTQPITTHLYTLFLQDTGNALPEGPIEAPPARAESVTGVWAADAQAFTAWLNSLAPGPVVYRLPTPDEARYAAGKTGSPRDVWTMRETDAAPTLWLAGDRTSPHLITGDELHDAVAADIRDTDVLTRLDWAGVRALAVALTHLLGHDRPVTGILALAGTLTQVLNRSDGLPADGIADLTRTLDTCLGHLHDRDPNLALDLAGALNHARAMARSRSPVQVLDQALGLDLVIDGAGPVADPQVAVMGRALAGTETADFTRTFLAQVDVPRSARFVLALDTLAPLARDACGRLGAVDDPEVPAWAAVVARRFAEAVVPVLERRRVPVGPAWAALRLPALALAAEADALDRAGDDFRQLAAGVTLLQRRAGERSRPEMILLARA